MVCALAFKRSSIRPTLHACADDVELAYRAQVATPRSARDVGARSLELRRLAVTDRRPRNSRTISSQSISSRSIAFTCPREIAGRFSITQQLPVESSPPGCWQTVASDAFPSLRDVNNLLAALPGSSYLPGGALPPLATRIPHGSRVVVIRNHVLPLAHCRTRDRRGRAGSRVRRPAGRTPFPAHRRVHRLGKIGRLFGGSPAHGRCLQPSNLRPRSRIDASESSAGSAVRQDVAR